MRRLLATKSADSRFHNVHLMGFASYVGTVRGMLMSAKGTASIVTPFIDHHGVKLLCDAWDAGDQQNTIWSVFVRDIDEELQEEAEKRGWRLFSYKPADSQQEEYGLHAKLVTIDNKRAIVGSMNLLKRNMYSNLELGMEFDDPDMLWRIQNLVRAFTRASGAEISEID